MRLALAGALVAVAMAAAPTLDDGAKGDCNVRASAAWATAGEAYVAEAIADGRTCELAVLMLVVRDPAGKPLWVDARIANQLMIFQETKDQATMAVSLAEWIDQEGSIMKTGESLPAWDRDQETPEQGEFPFYPEESVDRELYTKYRRADFPLFCYVQGMESMACVVLDRETGEMTKVGVQTFPG